MTQGSFEGKLHAFRRTQDGVVVSFVIHPNDVSADLAMANLGTRMMIGYAEIGDDGKPLSAPSEVRITETKPKERRNFAELRYSQQAGMRCNDPEFRTFLASLDGGAFLMLDLDMAAEAVRTRCGVKSRSELDDEKNFGPRGRWIDLEASFQSWRTEQRYPEEVRR